MGSVHKVLKFSILPLFFSFLFASSVFAASKYHNQAEKYLNRRCSRTRVPGIYAVLCDFRVRLDEQEQRDKEHDEWVDTLSTKVEDLQEQIDELKNQIPPPEPERIVFAENASMDGSDLSPAFPIPEGYKSITFKITYTGTLINWAPQVSFNSGASFRNQHRFGCGGTCLEVTLPIISDYYRVGLGTSSGTYTAVGVLNEEPGGEAMLLGNGVSLPFTSATFDATGYNTIIVTVEQGNPQHLTGISLQRKEGPSFVEKEHVNCDGGAICPLQELPLLGGFYRVVMEGSNPDALIGALLRP